LRKEVTKTERIKLLKTAVNSDHHEGGRATVKVESNESFNAAVKTTQHGNAFTHEDG
jgi:hypothetical protein